MISDPLFERLCLIIREDCILKARELSGSTARSEGSPAKYLGIVNISVNKEEMLALLPLASFCTTSRVTV